MMAEQEEIVIEDLESENQKLTNELSYLKDVFRKIQRRKISIIFEDRTGYFVAKDKNGKLAEDLSFDNLLEKI